MEMEISIVISMNTSEKAELTTLTLHIERFLKSIPEKMGRRIQEIAEHYALQANAINLD